MNDNLKKLQHFILADMKIKDLILKMAPSVNSYDETGLVDYVSKIYSNLKYIFFELKKVAFDFNIGAGIQEKIDNIQVETLDNFIKCETNPKKLAIFYENFISNMSLELINSVKEECIGYNMFYIPYNSVAKTKSINELLHVIHSYIINNQNIYEKTNLIGERELINGEPVRLYGVDNEFSRKLLNSFPIGLDCGYTDIVSFGIDNRAMMMVRDLGHALTIEFEPCGDKIKVKYFIPKLCNIDMINKLPGVNRVPYGSKVFSGATGAFVTDNQNVYNDLFRFMASVPTDKDMEIIGNYKSM